MHDVGKKTQNTKGLDGRGTQVKPIRGCRADNETQVQIIHSDEVRARTKRRKVALSITMT